MRLLTALVARLEDVPDEALRHARALSLLEPADEAAQASLVRLLRATGRWREAEEQFQSAQRGSKSSTRRAPARCGWLRNCPLQADM